MRNNILNIFQRESKALNANHESRDYLSWIHCCGDSWLGCSVAERSYGQ